MDLVFVFRDLYTTINNEKHIGLKLCISTTFSFSTSNLLFGGSQKSAYLCNAFLQRRILRAY